MPIAIDFAGWRPSPKMLTDAGVTIVIRYLKLLPNSYAIDAAELAGYLDAGIAVVFVWEQTETSWMTGSAGGQSHGREARRQVRELALELKRPDLADAPIIVAYDYNIQPFQLPSARDYQRGFKQWAGTVGVYGTAFLIADFFGLGIASYAMQTNARGWYGNHDDSPHAGLIQHYAASVPNLTPVEYDVDTIALLDVGQYPRPTAPHPTPEPIVTEDDMKGLGLAQHSNGTISLTNLVTRRRLADVPEEARVCAIYKAVTGEDIPHFALTDADIESIPDVRVVPVSK